MYFCFKYRQIVAWNKYNIYLQFTFHSWSNEFRHLFPCIIRRFFNRFYCVLWYLFGLRGAFNQRKIWKLLIKNVSRPINKLRPQKARPFLISQSLDLLIIIYVCGTMEIWYFFHPTSSPSCTPPDVGFYRSTKPSTWFTAAHFGFGVRQSYIARHSSCWHRESVVAPRTYIRRRLLGAAV